MIARPKIAEVWLKLVGCKEGRTLSVLITPHGRLKIGNGDTDSLLSTQVGTYDRNVTLADFEDDVREAERQHQQSRSSDEVALTLTGMLG